MNWLNYWYILTQKIPEHVNAKKAVNIVEKIPNFDEQRKGKWLKILTLKQMFERLPVALAQIKTGNTSENL